MSNKNHTTSYDSEMDEILQGMIDRDEDITARGIIRLHSKLNSASAITRNPNRMRALISYKEKQSEYRKWQNRVAKQSPKNAVLSLAAKAHRINELERQVHILTASHIAMLRAVGEAGGFAKWLKFFKSFRDIRADLFSLGALPKDLESLQIAGSTNRRKSTKA